MPRRIFAICVYALALVISVSVFGQAPCTTNGSQRAILPGLPGDQIRAQTALSPVGGYMVWEDNLTDGRGQGISALALDNNFAPIGSQFRVNQVGADDQEHPQAVLLPNNAGAVFVWQGGRRSINQHIYARFLSSSPTNNSWLAGDVLVNTFTNNTQENPAIAVLTNGNLIVVWQSLDEFAPDSMKDIYAQILSPTGAKIGPEFLVNQFTANNQRTPAVAALSAGGFVVAWVSELERCDSCNSVDIYSRLFSADGSAAGNEFRVNTSTNVCANPSVAATTNGTFAIAWGELDLTLMTNPGVGAPQLVSTNGWDVYAATFGGGVTNPTPELVNTFRFGDQFAPKISANGPNYLVVWTSMGQDGSWEGVFGQFLGEDGSHLGAEFLVNTTTVGRQILPSVASDGSQRYLSVWSSIGPGGDFDLFAQLYALPGYVPGPSVATFGPVLNDPFPDPTLVTAPPLPVMDPDFGWGNVTNGLALARGVYHGLFYDTNGASPSSAGYFAISLGYAGVYTGRIMLAGNTYYISGVFSRATGCATNSIGVGPNAKKVRLQIDLAGGREVQGSIVSPSGWSAFMQADAQTPQIPRSASAAAYAGTYSFIIPPGDVGPEGDSVGTVQVDSLGNLTWVGTLADGTKVSQSTVVSQNGIWPLYASLYGGRGSILSWMQFSTNGTFGGNVVWLDPAGVTLRYYPHGFTNDVEAAGSLWNRPAPRTRLAGWTNGLGSVVFSLGGLGDPFTNLISLGSNNLVTDLTLTNKLKMVFNPANGLFIGSAINPETGGLLPFHGIMWDGSVGGGFFLNPLGTNDSGEINLGPTP